MRTRPRRWWLLFSLAVAPLTRTAGVAASSTIDAVPPRYHDPVVVQVSQLADLEHHDSRGYRLYSRRRAILEPIPFQFDERDGEDFVFRDGTGEPAFALDADDELVFMARDAGEQATPDELPADHDEAREIEVHDPVTGGRAWVYLLHFSGTPPPPSTSRYAAFDAASNRARALSYEITYAPERSYFTDVRVRGAQGVREQALLARTRLLVNPTFSLLLTSWSPVFDEESFSSSIDGIRNGPVRAIRRVRQSLDLGAALPAAPGGTVYTYFYASSYWTPTVFSIPAVALGALETFRFRELEDFGADASGIEYWDGANPRGVRFTGQSRPDHVDSDHEWWAISGPGGACLHAFFIPDRWREWGIVRGTAFVDGGDAEPGVEHAAGFELLNMQRLQEAGDHRLLMVSLILSEPFAPGAEAALLQMVKQPLEVIVHGVG